MSCMIFHCSEVHKTLEISEAYSYIPQAWSRAKGNICEIFTFFFDELLLLFGNLIKLLESVVISNYRFQSKKKSLICTQNLIIFIWLKVDIHVLHSFKWSSLPTVSAIKFSLIKPIYMDMNGSTSYCFNMRYSATQSIMHFNLEERLVFYRWFLLTWHSILFFHKLFLAGDPFCPSPEPLCPRPCRSKRLI